MTGTEPHREEPREERPPVEEGPAVAIESLSVIAGEQTVFRGATLSIRKGELVLLVGVSGAGKTVLLKILAGIIGPWTPGFDIDGHVEVAGRDVFGSRRPVRDVGIVFQDFGLLDEWSVLGNIRFARDHGGRRDPRAAEERDAVGLLEEFGLDPRARPANLSVGQRQRVAIVRTLAYNPAIIVYDEPTSGLDPANARRVAARIRRTHDLHGKTTVVATHDFPNLMPIADRVVIIDSQRKSILPASPDALPERMEGLVEAEREGTPAPGATVPSRLRHRLEGFLVSGANAVELSARFTLHLLPRWPRIRWGLRYLRYYLSLVAGPTAILYIGIASLIIGFVATFFTFRYLPFRAYTEPLIIEDLLGSIGYALFRILIPLIGCILIAARSGAAVASDVGSRSYSQQLDAMRSLGVAPSRYLLTSIAYAFLIGTPFLIAIGFYLARLGSVGVFAFTHPEHSSYFWDENFHWLLRTEDSPLYTGTAWMFAKVIVSGLGVGAIAFARGESPKRSAREVSRGITRTVIAATLYVIIVQFAFAFFEYEPLTGPR